MTRSNTNCMRSAVTFTCEPIQACLRSTVAADILPLVREVSSREQRRIPCFSGGFGRLTRGVTAGSKNACMNKQHFYVIPKGTRIKTRNVRNDLRLSPYVTKKAMTFDHISCTGDGGVLLYFRRNDWLIVVDSELVIERAIAPAIAG